MATGLTVPNKYLKNKGGKFTLMKVNNMLWLSFIDFNKLKTFAVYELHYLVLDINLCYGLPLSRAQFGFCWFFPLHRNLTCGTRATNGKGEVTLFQLYKLFIWLIKLINRLFNKKSSSFTPPSVKKHIKKFSHTLWSPRFRILTSQAGVFLHNYYQYKAHEQWTMIFLNQ